MAKDVLITPLNGIIQFSSSAGAGTGQIKVDSDDLVISNLVGDVLLGDGASDVFIGNGSDNVDIVFEQNGEIRDDGTGKNLTIGSKTTNLFISGSSTIAMQKDGGKVGIGKSTATKELEVKGSISASGDLFANGNLRISGAIKLPQTSDIILGPMSTFPTTNTTAIQWDFPSDDTFIYAQQSSSDVTFLVFEQRDNTTSDANVFWFNDYRGPNKDSFPLYMDGSKLVVNYIYDKRTTFARDGSAVNGKSNNVDFYLLKSGSSSVSAANSLIFGDVDDSQVTINGDITASGDISASVTSTGSFGAVYTSGKVGVGTTSPSMELEVVAGANGGILVNRDATTINSPVEVGFRHTTSEGDAANGMRSYRTNEDTSYDQELRFFTTDGADGQAEHLTIKHNGKIGIGTTSPNNPLSVSGSMSVFNSNNTSRLTVGEGDDSGESTNNCMIIETTGASNKSRIFTKGTSNDFVIETMGNNSDIHLSSDRDIRFGVNNNSAYNFTEKMIMKFDGTFGIGTSSPTELLEIGAGGRIKLTPNTALTGSIYVNANDQDYILSTENDSATGDPQQFVLKHNSGATELINRRGNLILSSSADVNITAGGDDVIIKAADDVDILVQGGETAAKFGGNGGVDLYHNNVKKFSTAGGGIDVTGHITASGNISSSGTITANSFVGNLSSISNLIANDGANRVLTSDNDGTLSGESALTINGAQVTMTGGVTANDSNDDAAFQIKGSSDDNLLIVNPTSNDRVGIGTDTPPEKLTVQGNISASGGFLGGTVGSQTTGSYDFPGAIMGYTNIGSNSGHAAYTITTSYAVPDSEMNVVFVVPKSGKIEIMVQVQVVDTSFSANTINCALSDAASYNTVGAQHEVSAFAQDETGTDVKTIRWSISGLVAGATLQYWFAIKANLGSSAQTLQWGGSGTGRFPDFIMKVTALPSNAVFL